MSGARRQAGAHTESRRLESLRRLEILDTPPDPEMDDVVDLLGQLLQTRFAAITFVDEETAWSKAVHGAELPLEVPREDSPADLALHAEAAVVELPVEPGSPLAAHPLVGGARPVARVAAAVIVSPDGQPVGAVEVGWDGHEAMGERGRGALERAARHVARLLELRGEASEYRRFVDLSPDAVTVLDLEGCIELANPALHRLLGVSEPDGLLGRTFLELVAPADRARVATELARVLFARRRDARLDLGLLRADGTTVLCAVTAGHLRGSRRSLQLSIHDLDERIRAEEERSRLSEQLAQAQRLDLAGQLANGLAHDLKNLLVVMHANLDLAGETLRRAESDGASLAPVAEDLDQLRSAVDRAGQLTTKLMQFARREPAGSAAVPLSDALDAVQALLGASIPASVEVRVELEEGLPLLAADPVQLEQVLVNLVMNAVDALPEGGTITVRAVHIARDELLRGDRERRDDELEEHVYVEISDDGVGMSDETLARAFEPLFTTKGSSRGAGLGLPTVQAFAEDVGGAVDISSRPGEGTTVTLLLPAAVSADSPPVPAGERDRLVGGARVLLVDPGEQARRVIVRMLEGAGYRVRAVPTAEEAVEAVREQGADVLLTELSLPGMSGWRLLEQLRAEEPELRALVFSASETTTSMDGVRTLVKPFSHTRLLRTLERLLQPSR